MPSATPRMPSFPTSQTLRATFNRACGTLYPHTIGPMRRVPTSTEYPTWLWDVTANDTSSTHSTLLWRANAGPIQSVRITVPQNPSESTMGHDTATVYFVMRRNSCWSFSRSPRPKMSLASGVTA